MRLMKVLLPYLLILALGTALGAQLPDARLSFAWVGIEFREPSRLSATETELLRQRLSSYLLEVARQEDYTLTAPRDAEVLRQTILKSPDTYRNWLAGNRHLTSQGIVALRLDRPAGAFQLEAFLLDPASGEVLFRVQRTWPVFDSLMEESRGLVYELFGLSAPVSGALVQANPGNSGNVGKLVNVTMQDLVGRWQGDFDLEEVRIEADGRAVARLKNNETMQLLVRIENNMVIITQNERNSAKMYRGSFSLDIANQIVKVARPMSWEFYLSNPNQLEGKKNTSNFTIEKGQIVQTDNTYSRKAVWTRIP